jgi:ribonuclease HI
MHIVHIITDGACSGNPGSGGWAAIVIDGATTTEHSGAVADTTNNRMELTGALMGLRAAPRADELHVHTDSQYLINGITRWVHGWQKNGWKTSTGKPVENRDLWEALAALVTPAVHWHYVRGHAGHVHNERANTLAQGHAGSGGGGGAPRSAPSTSVEPVAVSAGSMPAFPCYISYVNKELLHHRTWASCQAATHGVSGAKFKKISTAGEYQQVLRSWGVR